jgi:primosomal protein N' (replication factor Y)
MFARIAVNVPSVSGVFDYHLPDNLAGAIGVGHLVSVPFGSQTVQGIVLELVSEAAVAETKPVGELIDPEPVITSAQIALARELADQTLAPLAAIIGLMLPAGIAQQADIQYSAASDQLPVGELSDTQKRLITLLQKRGALRGRQIDRQIPREFWEPSAKALKRKGFIKTKSVLPPASVRPKVVRVAQLAAPPEMAEAAMNDLGTKQTLARRQAALRFLINEPSEVNVSWIYAQSGCNLADLNELADRDLITLRETEIWRDPLEKIVSRELGNMELTLSAGQATALSQIVDALASTRQSTFLLHGVTGSGKTEIYLRAAAEAIRQGKQALILVPEIALTPQTVRRFLAHFPGQVGLIHSKLSEGERYDTWRRARAGLLKVIIGARSALFAPLQNIGLIVVDECHDGSYHQSEPPFYHAATAAQMYARLCGAVCVLGSATPLVGQRYQAEAGAINLLELPKRVWESGHVAVLPPVSIVDMRDELKSGNRGIFSRALSTALEQTLARDEQAILFLNRRGTATYVFCRDCGTALKCPKCDTPLTLHVGALARSNVETLLCHRCGYKRQMPHKCAQCGSGNIRQYGLGSEKVEAEVGALFPQARVLRWDWETTRQKDAHEVILGHFSAHRADVLVGTQMLAKGLDLPLVTLVGIVLADVGLNLPDPFAGEKTFQVLTQVAGRAGRTTRGGRVILQTFQPESEVIQMAARHDYAGFYEKEIVQRKRLGYPPFARLVRLEFRHRDNVECERAANTLAASLRKRVADEKRVETDIIGAAPCFFAKVNGINRWQIVVRSPDPVSFMRGRVPEGWRVEVDPASLL